MMRSIMMLVLGLNVVTSFSSKIPKFSVRSTSNNLKMTSSFYDIVEKDANGEAVKFDKFKGKVLYGVNVASKCGYTASGYALLSKVSKIPGVEVALFPCNQFLGQEPGSDADVANFCVLKGKGVPAIQCFCLPLSTNVLSYHFKLSSAKFLSTCVINYRNPLLIR
mmetsp:Transcript_12052/g.17376  ORF Transcript_12052/g.17376 Transcript_12052/m.17376 type:complete len:165 (+) Transcript_12052:92-586(+)